MSTGLILFILLIVLPILEVSTFITVGGVVGLWPTIALVILTAAIGSFLIRMQGIGIIRNIERQTNSGAMPVFDLFSGVCLLIAGAFLLTPGFITDSIGFVLLIPAFRQILYRQFKIILENRQKSRNPAQWEQQSWHQHAQKEHDDTVIEGEFVEIDEPDMPKSRGSWDKKQSG